MNDVQALRILHDACQETLDAARGGDPRLADMVQMLERVCGRLELEIRASP